jgi:hypothetical protein
VGLTGNCCVWYVIFVNRSKLCACHQWRCDSTPYSEEAHPTHCLRILRRLWHSPHSFHEGDRYAGWHPVLLLVWVAFYYQSAITEGNCCTVPMQCSLPPGCSMLLWEQRGRTIMPPHTLSISRMSLSLYQQDEPVAGTAETAMITAASACP